MTFGLPGLTLTGLPTRFLLLILLSFALTVWAATVAANQRRLGVLEQVLLIGIAVFSPFVGSVVVLILAPRLAPQSQR